MTFNYTKTHLGVKKVWAWEYIDFSKIYYIFLEIVSRIMYCSSVDKSSIN